MHTLKLFSTPVNFFPNKEQATEMLDAQRQFKDAHGDEIGDFTHGVSKNGTIGGIALGSSEADFKAVAYCQKPDGSLITTYYYPTRTYYLAGSPKFNDIDKFKVNPDGKQSSVRIHKEFWGPEGKKNIPTSIKKTFGRSDNKEVYIINELKPNGNKVRTVKYPSGNVYTKVTNPFGDVIEYSVKKEQN